MECQGAKCSIQKSSLATEDCIWLGCENKSIKTFKGNGTGWGDISLDDLAKKLKMQDILINDRMHLTREQVKALLPILKKFVLTGEIS